MIKSMTGYGKADVCLDTGKVTIEIRTLNGKTADVNIKTTLLPKDKELLVRQKLADRLHRGTIDFFVSYEANAVSSAKHINTEMAAAYFRQVAAIGESLGVKTDSALYLNSILRFPDVIDNTRQDIITADNWDQVDAAVDRAIDNVCDYRSREGVALYKDVTSRVQNILNLEDEVESFDGERILAVRSKIEKAIEDLKLKPDQSRWISTRRRCVCVSIASISWILSMVRIILARSWVSSFRRWGVRLTLPDLRRIIPGYRKW